MASIGDDMASSKNRLSQRLLIRSLLYSLVPALVASVPAFGEDAERPVSFANDVIPILTKAGCNTGVCHAKAGGGQNGFQLSLLGFEPLEDYEHLVMEGRGRRLFAAAPDRSLVLMKASGQLPHGGGVRLEPTSEAYSLLRRWIDQGAVFARDSDPELASVEVQPERGSVPMHAEQQLTALATYSDGSNSKRWRNTPTAASATSLGWHCSNPTTKPWRTFPKTDL